ncbi:hypothetical protein VNO77_27725 [Canavalia gladiata]|uniref:Secreted protein n=1 Tax=Canavalia gladiata TaxID=3824 RepID=A0AAN9Q7B5_CANGL
MLLHAILGFWKFTTIWIMLLQTLAEWKEGPIVITNAFCRNPNHLHPWTYPATTYDQRRNYVDTVSCYNETLRRGKTHKEIGRVSEHVQDNMSEVSSGTPWLKHVIIWIQLIKVARLQVAFYKTQDRSEQHHANLVLHMSGETNDMTPSDLYISHYHETVLLNAKGGSGYVFTTTVPR